MTRTRWRTWSAPTAKAPTPELARRLTVAQLSAALKRARRRDIAEKSRTRPVSSRSARRV
ncbi:hypothetical protein FMEAI12_6570002 [Parafrankia sp. Ea1.12]|nr:hypothetical protein FMEAI12_6570002 [Parafrankia sp. Ea1.12]